MAKELEQQRRQQAESGGLVMGLPGNEVNETTELDRAACTTKYFAGVNTSDAPYHARTTKSVDVRRTRIPFFFGFSLVISILLQNV